MVGSKLLSSVQGISIAIQAKLTELFGSPAIFYTIDNMLNFTAVPSFKRSVLWHRFFFSVFTQT